MTEHDELLLMLRRLQDAQTGLAAAIQALVASQPTIEVAAPVVNVPAPVVSVETQPVEMPDFRLLVREIMAEVAASSQRSDQILQVIVERFEALAEKVGKRGPMMTVGGRAGPISLSSDDRDILREIRDGQADPASTRFDYDVRTDSNPVYIGSAPTGTATGAAGWTISKFAYDGSNRTTRIDVREGIWDDRASLAWGF